MGRPDFKSGEGRLRSSVGSTPIPFRQKRKRRSETFVTGELSNQDGTGPFSNRSLPSVSQLLEQAETGGSSLSTGAMGLSRPDRGGVGRKDGEGVGRGLRE